MKKIFFVLGGMTRGGAERVISILANHLANLNWDVGILTLLTYKCDYLLNPAVRLIDLSGSGGSRIKKIPYWLRELRVRMRDEKPDSVVSFVARINILVLLAAMGLRQKVFISERNDPAKDGRSIIVKIAAKLLYPKADGIVFQTRHARNYFKKRIADKGIVIGNPIQVAATVSDEKKNKIVSVGRLSKQKNHCMLIEAFSKVHKNLPEYELYIYGEGDLRDKLQDQIHECALADFIFLPGNVPDIHERIADAKLFVLSSEYEGLSNALLEAMAMGLPVISTDCAGSVEVIRNGENGLLVPIGDINAMIKSVENLLRDDDLRQKLGVRAAEDAKAYHKNNILGQWFDLLTGGESTETECKADETVNSDQADRDADFTDQMVGKN